MLRTSSGFCTTRSSLRVCVGIASVCVLVLSSLIWSAPAAVGQAVPDGFPLSLETLDGDRLAPLASSIEMLVMSVGDVSLLFVDFGISSEDSIF